MENLNVNEKKVNSPYSVRLPEDLKSRIIETMAVSGESAANFFDKMLNHFQVAESKKPMRQELKDVERALVVISRAVEGLVIAIDDVELEKNEQAHTYARESSKTAEEFELAQTRAVEIESAMSATIKDIEGKLVDSETVNIELKKEIERLRLVEAVVTELKVTVKEFEVKQAENDKEIKKLRSVEAMVEDVREDAKVAKENLKVALNESKNAVESANKANIELLERLKIAEKKLEQADIDKQKAVLEAQTIALEQRQTDLLELDKLRKLVAK